jgi:hypothetical protein
VSTVSVPEKESKPCSCVEAGRRWASERDDGLETVVFLLPEDLVVLGASSSLIRRVPLPPRFDPGIVGRGPRNGVRRTD